jgi:alkylation response protein AidB-like acyl-CoA dehydrogenase
MFAEAIEDLLQSHCTPAQVRAIEQGGSFQALAAAIEASGFHALMAPESHGGGDATWNDLHDIVVLAGLWCAPLPVAQTLAARALVQDPLALPPGMLTLAPALEGTPEGGVRAAHVPFLKTAGHVIGVWEQRWVCLPVAGASIQPNGIHGSLSASARWSAAAIRPLDARVAADRLPSIAALLHAGLIAGAMRRAFELTMPYANERTQFGKPIGKYQAIQQQLAVMAEQVAAGGMAAQAAFAANGGDLPGANACAVAKARTSEAAAQVAAIAHAVHGAIGITEEYDLQLATRRLHEWRIAHGSEAHWHRFLGRQMLDSTLPTATDFIRTLL